MGQLPTLESAKAQARALRMALEAEGRDISHSAALELAAKSHGLHDWNTLHAAIGNRREPPVAVGQIVQGAYLTQPVVAEVLGLTHLSEGRWQVVLDFDEAVDVVTFDSFSNFRKRVIKIIGADGQSFDTTSDGVPHLVLTL